MLEQSLNETSTLAGSDAKGTGAEPQPSANLGRVIVDIDNSTFIRGLQCLANQRLLRLYFKSAGAGYQYFSDYPTALPRR